MQKRKVIVKITVDYDFPDDWSDDEINFALNDSSWCLGNALDKINEIAKQNHGCICHIAEAEVLPKNEREDFKNER